MPDVTMPRLSDSMEEGTILKWLKSDGDEVKRGDELAEIETDKATLTYEADADGVLEIVAKEGDTLPIGEVIAKLGDGSGGGGGGEEKAEEPGDDGGEDEKADDDGGEDEKADDDDGEEKPADDEGDEEPAEHEGKAEEPEEEEEEPKAEAEADGDSGEDAEKPEPKGGSGDNGRVKASPVARRLAEDRGVDLATLEGSGPGGRIVKADVEKAAEGGGEKAEEKPKKEAKAEQDDKPKDDGKAKGDEKEPEPSVAAASAAKQPARSEPEVAERGTAKGDVRVEELTRVQQVVARRMAEAKATIPEFTLTTEVDMERAVELRAKFKKVAGEDGVVPSYNDMVVKAAAMALRAFPRANAAYKDNKFELYSRVNIGVAVAAQDSLVVPTVFDADQKSMGEIARDMRKLAARVRDGTVTPPELSGGTFTVSNLGMYGVTEFTAVINSPQAAILAVGALVQEPKVVDGKVVPRHVMRITIVSDHRILYGADAAQFLAKVRELLEEPLGLAL